MNRRSFLSLLGLSSAAAAALPIEELIDRLAFARSPTTSIYLPGPVGAARMVQVWADAVFMEYTRGVVFAAPTEAEKLEWLTNNNGRIVYTPFSLSPSA